MWVRIKVEKYLKQGCKNVVCVLNESPAYVFDLPWQHLQTADRCPRLLLQVI